MTGTLDVNDPFRLAKYYLQILTGVTNDQVVLDPGGWLPFGGSETIPFYLNEADNSVDAIVLSAVPQLIRVRLRAPSGQIFDQTSPVMNWTFGVRMGFYRFTLPVPGVFSAEGPGRWEILLDWKGSPQRAADRLKSVSVGVAGKALRYDAMVHARSDVEMATTLSQDRLTPGAKVTVRVRLSQYDVIPLDSARVVAHVAYPDGAASVLGLTPRGDGVYDTEFAAPFPGVYTVRVSAMGKTLRGLPFTREAVRTAYVWQGGGDPPPTRHDDGWCSVIRCLLESKALDPEVLKRLGIRVDGLLKCCEQEERIPPRRR
jgi:hypothetical protein